MIDAKNLRRILNMPGYRRTILNKTQKEKDPENIEFLENWKKHSKAEQIEFCEKILNSDNFMHGFAYGYEKKEQFKQGVKDKFKWKKKK